MGKVADLYAMTCDSTLTYPTPNPNQDAPQTAPFGKAHAKYTVRQVTDLSNLGYKRSYQIDCTLRIVVPSTNPFVLAPSDLTSFNNYPAIVQAGMLLNDTSNAFGARLEDYSPRTLNTAITTSSSMATGETQSMTTQRTSGSSTSQANTYGGSVTLQASVWDAGVSASADFSETSTVERNDSLSAGRDAGTSRQHDSSSQISVKDWSAYASLDAAAVSPTWVWGQEYPWDVIQYRAQPITTADAYVGTTASPPNSMPIVQIPANPVLLPQAVESRLWFFDDDNNEAYVFPPSQLSLFGLDFVMKARWRVDLPDVPVADALTVTHQISYVVGSHGLYASTNAQGTTNYDLEATLAVLTDPPYSFTGPQLNLPLLALDPIVAGHAENGAAIGFGYSAVNRFIYPAPGADNPTGAFQIVSPGNNLLVSGTGFSSTSPLALSYDGTASSFPTVSLTIQFKIVDSTRDYTLYLKHWLTAPQDILLQICINSSPPISRLISSYETQAGDGNVLEIVLRNKDFASADFYDYLQLGCNTVQIGLTAGANNPAGYTLQAVAVGSS